MSYSSHFCPDFHKAVELIGKRWTGAIIREMLAGACRFSELRGAIPDISDRMLCARLKGLEEEGIVERLVHPETPVRVEYQLTGKGRELEQVFAAVDRWAGKWVDCPASPREGPEAA